MYWDPPEDGGSLEVDTYYTIVSGLTPCTNFSVNVTASTGGASGGVGLTSNPSNVTYGSSGFLSRELGMDLIRWS